MKKIIGILMLTIIANHVFAQEFEVPNNYEFTSNEDYVKYEGEVLKSIDWLLTTPIKDQADKRKEVNTFLMTWLTGTKTVSVEIKTEIVNFMDPNPDLLMIFLCGWTQYSIETGDNKNKILGTQKGIEAVIDFYTKNNADMKKDANVEKYIKMQKKGTLEDFITKNI